MSDSKKAGPSPAGRGQGEGAAQPHGQFLVYPSEDGRLKIDVRLEGKTAWLTQAQMAELFQTTVPNVNMHLRNIYAESELQPTATIQEFLTVRQEGARQVCRKVGFSTRPSNTCHPNRSKREGRSEIA